VEIFDPLSVLLVAAVSTRVFCAALSQSPPLKLGTVCRHRFGLQLHLVVSLIVSPGTLDVFLSNKFHLTDLSDHLYHDPLPDSYLLT